MQFLNTVSHFESLADSRIQHDPVHPAIHPDSTNEKILRFSLLLSQSASIRCHRIYNYS